MNTWDSNSVLALWFCMHAFGLSLPHIIFREIQYRISPVTAPVTTESGAKTSGQLVSEECGEKTSAALAVVGGALMSLCFTLAPSFRQVNENWDYAPTYFETPFPWCWLLLASASGGAMAACAKLAYERFRHAPARTTSHSIDAL